jgi:hypothetical protein
MYGQPHHPRGRLRLRFSRLKHNSEQLTSVMDALRLVPGVERVEGSPYSGGILISYHGTSGDKRRFWDDIETVLATHGLHHNPRPLARQARPPAASGRVSRAEAGAGAAGVAADALVDKLVDKLAGKLAERCALALVAALF